MSVMIWMVPSCTPNPVATIIIADASKPYEELVEVEIPEGVYVDKLYVHVSGYINDTARINEEYDLLPGKLDSTLYASDWYAPGFVIVYEPLNVTEGSLSVQLEFVAF